MSPKETINKLVELFNKNDANGLAELYHDDAINHQVVNDPVLGKESIKEMYKEEFASADLFCIVENIFEEGEWVTLEWKDPYGLRGCDIYQIIDGKIKMQRGYWDKHSFLKQQNLPITDE